MTRTSELMLSQGMKVFQYLLTHMGHYSFSQLFGIPEPVKLSFPFFWDIMCLCFAEYVTWYGKASSQIQNLQHI